MITLAAAFLLACQINVTVPPNPNARQHVEVDTQPTPLAPNITYQAPQQAPQLMLQPVPQPQPQTRIQIHQVPVVPVQMVQMVPVVPVMLLRPVTPRPPRLVLERRGLLFPRYVPVWR